MITTSISITEEQAEWIKNNSINLSEWVRKKLDAAINPNEL